MSDKKTGVKQRSGVFTGSESMPVDIYTLKHLIQLKFYWGIAT